MAYSILVQGNDVLYTFESKAEQNRFVATYDGREYRVRHEYDRRRKDHFAYLQVRRNARHPWFDAALTLVKDESQAFSSEVEEALLEEYLSGGEDRSILGDDYRLETEESLADGMFDSTNYPKDWNLYKRNMDWLVKYFGQERSETGPGPGPGARA